MKKLLASVLSIAIVMSLTACSGKQQEQTTAVTATSETTAEASTTKAAESSPIETTAAFKNVSECVKDVVEKTTMMVPAGDEDNEEPEECVYHYPQILIKSSYADEVNKEIASAVEKYMKDVNRKDADERFISTEYIAYLTKEGILSVVFISDEYYEYCKYKIYNIDTKTGEKVDNARIAQAAGVSSIRNAAMDALQAFYNKLGEYKIKNYKVVLKKGKKKNAQMKAVEKTFSEKYLNDNMQIGVTADGKLFFVTIVETSGGAGEYDCLFDANGCFINDEDNPYWVGERSPEDEAGEGEEE